MEYQSMPEGTAAVEVGKPNTRRSDTRGRPRGLVMDHTQLRADRLARGLTRDELAAAVHVSGRTIQRAENGYPISARTWRAIRTHLAMYAHAA